MASRVWFHGSSEVLEELEANDPGYEGSLGYGLYLTSQPEFAGVFGANLHEVENPVPDELIANIEPQTYECGESLTIYTPGSAPFTFEIEDRRTGQTHRYSVLGNCEETVKAQVASLDGFRPSEELRAEVGALPLPARRAVGKLADKLIERLVSADRPDLLVEELVADVDWDVVGEENGDAIEAVLETLADEAQEYASERASERLGTEIDLDDLSAVVGEHGYSALHIDGYAPGGDELVIFDDAYLPVPVLRTQERP